MENIKPLLVLLTCDFKNEKLSALLKDIVQTFPNTDHEHTKQIRIVNCADIFQSTAEDAPLPAEEAVKKLKTIMKPPKHEHDVSVYLLYDYPISVAHLVGLIDNSKEYSILDGVVKLVANTSGTVKSSVHGPDSTVAEVPPPVTIDSEDKALAKLDVNDVLQHYKAKSGGLWIDVSYDEFNTMHKNIFTNAIEEMPVPSMVDQLADMLLHMCTLKSEFKDWTSQKTMTKLATDPAAIKRIRAAVASAAHGDVHARSWMDVPLYRTYQQTLSHIPRKVHGPGTVLYSIVDAVSHDPATVLACDDGSLSVPDPFKGLGADDGSIGSTGEKPFHMLKQGYSIAVQNLKANAFTIHEGDSFHSRIINAKDILLRGDEMDPDFVGATSVFGFERDALFVGHVPRLIGQGGMPLHASTPLKERCIQETELLTFTSLSAFDFHRYNQLIYFNRMVERAVPPRIDFTGLRKAEDGGGDVSALKRKFFKNVPAFTLPQIFAKELLKEPVVSREYYPLTDELLICFYWPPPHRRMEKRTWDPAKHMHLRPNFDEFLVFSERKNFTPRTAASVHNCIDIPAAEMKKYTENTVFITPADKSVVLVKESSSVKKAWVTVHNKDVMFGLRELSAKAKPMEDSTEGMFFLHTEDDVRTTVTIGAAAEKCAGKPDGNGTVCLTLVFPDELRVSACSNGTVNIAAPIDEHVKQSTVRMMGNGAKKSPSRREIADRGTALIAPELQRLVCNGGCIIRYLAKGGPFTKDIYFPDGTRVLIRDMSNIELSDPEDRLPSYKYPVAGVMETILLKAPAIDGPDGPMDWTYVVLDIQGRVLYSFEDYEQLLSQNQSVGSDGVMHLSTTILNISNYYIDAETEALITEFEDGRVICISVDDLQDVYFPEGTRVTTHQSGQIVLIDRAGHPTLEIDTEIDIISKRHSQGFMVPIAKGGDRTRTKMVLPDGTAVLIKYDTKVTSTYNGSVKAIRRDKSVVYAVDGGIVNYVSSDDWNNRTAEEFEIEKKDAENKPRDKPLLDRSKFNSHQRSVNIRTMNNTTMTYGQATLLNDTNDMTMAESMGVTESSGTKKKKFTRRKPKKLAQLGLSASPKRFQSMAAPEEELAVVEPKSKAAKYSFDLNICQCVIEDHENNIFDIDLADDPTNPMISLAGEVDGCKPDAVAATNIEPRLFVVSRSADAIEICRYEEIEELAKAFGKCNEDFVKYTSDVLCPPCNLGGAVQHSIFWHRKMKSTAGFDFASVFAERPWTTRARPAALSISLKRLNSRYLTAEDQRIRQQKHDIFITKTYSESAPLSDEGYAHVAEDIARWNSFRLERDKTEHTFAIEDHRTEEEKKEEGDIMKKLKGMYKAHKQSKKKESERNKIALVSPMELPVIVERPEETEDEFDAASRDEEEDELSPEEIELNAAFETFAVRDDLIVSVGDDSVTDSIVGTLNVQSLQNVFVQIFNRFISFNYISDAYYDDTGLPLEENEDISIDYDMFRRLHYHLQSRIADEDMTSETSSLASAVGSKPGTATLENNFFSKSDSGLKVDFSNMNSRKNSGSSIGGSMGGTGSARGSGIMAVRNMNKTVIASTAQS